MKTSTPTIPFFGNYNSFKESSLWKQLEHTAHGEWAQELLLAIEDGLSPIQIKEEWTHRYDWAIEALKGVMPGFKEDALIYFALARRLKDDYEAEIDWDLLLKVCPCVWDNGHCLTTCKGCSSGCAHKLPIKFIADSLIGAKILDMRGGIYLERLITATSLGVPWNVIERSRRINLKAVLEVLSECGLKLEDVIRPDILPTTGGSSPNSSSKECAL